MDPDAGHLHLVQTRKTARRYGAGKGAAAHAWNGAARLQFARAWPRWKVPDEMIARRPKREACSVANGGMDPGPGNPLGARAPYLFQNGKDTLCRIHGACEPHCLGKPESCGCIRLHPPAGSGCHRPVSPRPARGKGGRLAVDPADGTGGALLTARRVRAWLARPDPSRCPLTPTERPCAEGRGPALPRHGVRSSGSPAWRRPDQWR
ncbi:MAG: L,D-transpeptidase [Tabrizicola sp.]|nr:L,D-transpeptidase [Tabrizicola sp.]MDP3261818.1 L,D-transpeptidase [Tabrizicola sp.]MDP3649574.1 L,D-transpeptidase [Paracoccaceae bacterium]